MPLVLFFPVRARVSSEGPKDADALSLRLWGGWHSLGQRGWLVFLDIFTPFGDLEHILLFSVMIYTVTSLNHFALPRDFWNFAYGLPACLRSTAALVMLYDKGWLATIRWLSFRQPEKSWCTLVFLSYPCIVLHCAKFN